MYTQTVADRICERLADGESLNAICKSDGMPGESTVRGWALDNVEGFAAKYARAREVGYERLADEIISISDDASGDVIETESGPKVDSEFVARSRLRVDSRKWMLSKMLPKVYGDKIAHTGADGGPLVVQINKLT